MCFLTVLDKRLYKGHSRTSGLHYRPTIQAQLPQR